VPAALASRRPISRRFRQPDPIPRRWRWRAPAAALVLALPRPAIPFPDPAGASCEPPAFTTLRGPVRPAAFLVTPVGSGAAREPGRVAGRAGAAPTPSLERLRTTPLAGGMRGSMGEAGRV